MKKEKSLNLSKALEVRILEHTDSRLEHDWEPAEVVTPFKTATGGFTVKCYDRFWYVAADGTISGNMDTIYGECREITEDKAKEQAELVKKIGDLQDSLFEVLKSRTMVDEKLQEAHSYLQSYLSDMRHGMEI